MTGKDIEKRKIAPGVFMPVIGFGCWSLPLDTCQQTCAEAIRVGWRHFDCAMNYGNSAPVGAAIRNSGIDRKEFFITTKLMFPPSYEADVIDKALLDGLAELNCDYVDLFLVHTASLGGPEPRKAMWEAFERLHDSGKTKAIGVSNYGKLHLQELLEYCRIRPACNQIELHPWCQPASHIEAFQNAGVQLVAYAAAAQNKYANELVLRRTANKHKKDSAQILLRWSYQRGFIPLIKSSTPAHMESNLDTFDIELSNQEMLRLDQKDTGDPPTGNIWGWRLNCE